MSFIIIRKEEREIIMSKGFEAILRDSYSGTEEKVIMKSGFYKGYDLIEGKNRRVLALKLQDMDGMPYANVTTNLGEFIGVESATYLDVNNLPEVEDFVKENHIGLSTGLRKTSGYVEYPLYKISPFVLESVLDEHDLNDYLKEFTDDEKYEDPERYKEIMDNPNYAKERLTVLKAEFCECLMEGGVELNETEQSFYDEYKAKEDIDKDER